MVRVRVKVRASFRVGGNQTIAPEENSPPPVRVRVWVTVSFGVGGGQFSSAAIILELQLKYNPLIYK